MEDFLKTVTNVGFPIAVESKIDNLATSINQLSTILSIKLSGNDDRKSP